MRYKIDSNDKTPGYLQLYMQLKEDIVNDVYPYKTKLPSKRLLAEELQTSVITVSHALDLLSDEGYIESRERSGYYVIYRSEDFPENEYTRYTKPNKNDKTENKQKEIADVTITHGVGELSFSMLAKTMRRTLLDYGENILEKSPNKGMTEFRIALSAYLSRNRGIHADPSQIIIGSGAEYLYSLIAQLFNKDLIIAVEDPCYEKIPQVYKAMGNKVEYLIMGTNGIRSEELQKTNAGILHVTPFHSYPSNSTANISKKNEYLKWAGEDKYIIEDNYDSEITISRKMEDSLFALNHGKRVIYMNTFSKTIAASLRIGYMVLPEILVEEFDQKLGFYSCTVPVYEQLVITELLKSGEFERHINRVRRRLRTETALKN